jgi:hypothetical protein
MTDWVRPGVKAAIVGAAALITPLALSAIAVATPPRAPGGVAIFDESGCAGAGNSAKVTLPFSVGITGLTPLSTTSVLYVTDKDAQPDVIYGPYTIPSVDIQGASCLEVTSAPAGTWKVDVVEEGSGFTDSKVFTIEDPNAPPTIVATTIPPTTEPALTTEPAPTSTDGSTPTTTTPPSTLPAEPTTPTTLPSISRPWEQLPWTIRPITRPTAPNTSRAPDSGALPGTGAATGVTLAASVGMIVLGLLALVASRRRAS